MKIIASALLALSVLAGIAANGHHHSEPALGYEQFERDHGDMGAACGVFGSGVPARAAIEFLLWHLASSRLVVGRLFRRLLRACACCKPNRGGDLTEYLSQEGLLELPSLMGVSGQSQRNEQHRQHHADGNPVKH